MKKSTLRKEYTEVIPFGAMPYDARKAKLDNIAAAIEKFESRISGKRGAEDARDRFFADLQNLYARPAAPIKQTDTVRLHNWKVASARTLAEKAGANFDEHASYHSGDYMTTRGLDFIGHWESTPAPYCDMGGEGLGLVEVSRTRVYAKSSNWRPSSVATRFLVGKNEAGTYFSHPVSPNCSTVENALQWIWGGKAHLIIQRQGDIALIGGNGGPKMPAQLPWGHKVNGDIITHATHPDLPVPSKPGERIIVGKRAAERASEATRD